MKNTKNKQILNFIEDFGFITSNICANVCYKNNKYPYNQACRKLKEMTDNKWIKRYKDNKTSEYIYVDNLSKNLSNHKYILIELYSYIYKNADSIEYFKLEEPWISNKYRSDAHIVYIKNGKLRGLLVEIEFYHKLDVNKYQEIYESNEVQNWYIDKYDLNVFPTVLIVNATGNPRLISDYYNIKYTDYTFKGIEKIL